MGMTINSIYNQSNHISSMLSKGTYQSSNTSSIGNSKSSTDQVQISQMGKMMSLMTSQMGRAGSMDMKAKMESFKSAYEDTGISKMDTSKMTDDEIQTALSSFASAMGESNTVQGTSIQEMSADQRKEALNGLQNMGKAITNSGNPGYGPMQMQGMKLPQGMNGMSFPQGMNGMRPPMMPQGMEAAGEVFQTTYQDLGIENLDVDAMSDQDITDMLKQFEESMGDYGPQDKKSVSEMSTEERKETLSQIQEMGKQMKSSMALMGQMNAQDLNGAESTESTSEKSYIDDLLEALDKAAEKAEKNGVSKDSYKAISDLINQMNFA